MTCPRTLFVDLIDIGMSVDLGIFPAINILDRACQATCHKDIAVYGLFGESDSGQVVNYAQNPK